MNESVGGRAHRRTHGWFGNSAWPCLAMGLVSALASPAYAGADEQAAGAADSSVATAPDAGSLDIVVSARRQDESSLRVPVSISAYSQAKIDQQGVKTIADLQRQVPGLTFNPSTSSIAVRGISSDAGAATTGVYIDDTPFQQLNVGVGTMTAIPVIFDLDRVEVLRGPQGTLFGAGAEGGAVRYITKQPSLTDFSVYGRAEVGTITYGGQDYEAGVAVGGPIVQDKIGARVSGFYRYGGGWIDQLDWRTGTVSEKNSNHNDTVSLRGALAFAPTETLKITPSVQFQKSNAQGGERGRSIFWQSLSDPDDGRFRTAQTNLVQTRDKWVLPTIKGELSLGDADFITNTSWFVRKQDNGYDGSLYMVRQYFGRSSQLLPGIAPIATASGIRLPLSTYNSVATVHNEQHNFVQEGRLQSSDPSSPLTWVVGAYYSNNRTINQEKINDPLGPQLVPLLFGISYSQYWGRGLTADGDAYLGTTNMKDTQLAGFGEATYKLLPGLSVTAGARYSITKFSFNSRQVGPINGGETSGAGSQKEKPFTPKLGVSYQIDPNNMIYATYAKGFRIGGANSPVSSALCASDLALLGITAAPLSYNSDETKSIEVGSKNRLLGGKLQIASSAYRVKWGGIQQAQRLTACGYRYIDNLGEATSKGFDVQVQARLSPSFEFNAAVGYTHGRFTKTIAASTGAIQVRDGNSLGTPDWQFAMGGQYSYAIGDHRAFTRIDYQHASQFGSVTPALDPLVSGYDATILKPPATDYVTARTGINLGRWDFSIFVDNLLNSHEILTRTHSSRTWPIYTQTSWRPRTYVLQAIVRY